MIVHQLAEQSALSATLISETTVGQAVEIFLTTTPAPCPRTHERRRRQIHAFLQTFADRPLAALRPFEIGRFLTGRADILAAWTQRNETQLIRRFFRWARLNLLIAVDPAQDFSAPPGQSDKHRCLSWQEETTLLRSLAHHQSPRSIARIILCRDTGMRAVNAHSLLRSQIDFQQREVFFLASKTHIPLHLPLTARLLEILEFCRNFSSQQFLFPYSQILQGKPFTAAAALFRRLKKQCGLVLDWHDLRHTFYTRFYEATQNHLLTEYVLGHNMKAHVDTTYWHPPGPEDLREAFEKFEAYQTQKLRQAQPLEEISPSEMWRELEQENG